MEDVFVCAFVGLNILNTVGSGLPSGIGILPKFFIGYVLLLKLLRIFLLH